MAMWTLDEREEINAAIKHEEDLHLLACDAYDQAKREKRHLKEVLREVKYNPVTRFYTYEQIINDVLRYDIF